MPKGENFCNPYRLLKLHPVPRIEDIAGKCLSHDRLEECSGRATAELLTLTPIVIGGRSDVEYDREEKENVPKAFAFDPVTRIPLIPGSGLKGCMKSYFELLCGQLNPKAFGYMDGEISRGHVFFNDARLDPMRSPANTADARNLRALATVLQSPKDRHGAFYALAEGQCIKIYHHQPHVRRPDDLEREGAPNVRTQIVALPAGCCFSFEMHFENLTRLQMAFLLRSVFLPAGLCHKIGGAKPLGAGSVNIRPLRLEVIDDAAARYRGAAAVAVSATTEACRLRIEEICRGVQFLPDAEEMLRWRPDDSNTYWYPGHAWFTAHPKTPLKAIDEVYPPNGSWGDGAADIERRWQVIADSASAKAESVRLQRQKADEEEQKALALARLSPEERVLQFWENHDTTPMTPGWVYSHDEMRKLVPQSFDVEKVQRVMLERLRSNPSRCEEWRKRNRKKDGNGPWKRLCEVAAKLGVQGYELP